MKTDFYTATLDLKQRRALIVGGGKVATQKLKGLPAGCRVKIVSPAVSPVLRALARRRGVVVFQRDFRATDVKGMDLIFATTDRPKVNQAVRQAALGSRAWVLVADAPSTGDLQIPALVNVAGLRLTLSTQGASPALAKALRRRLAGDLRASNLGWVLRLLLARRAWLKARPAIKRRLLSRLTAAGAMALLLGSANARAKVKLRKILVPLLMRG